MYQLGFSQQKLITTYRKLIKQDKLWWFKNRIGFISETRWLLRFGIIPKDS
jgi:hypothetical protein